MSTINRVQYLLMIRGEAQYLVRLQATGRSITIQTPRAEAKGEPPIAWAVYGEGFAPDINDSVIESLFKLQYRTKIDQSVAAKIFAKDVKKFTDAQDEIAIP